MKRAGIRRAVAARRDFPGDAAADRLVEELAERISRCIEHFERFVDVIWQQEAGDGIDHRCRVKLVDRRFARVVARSAGSTRRNSQRAGRNNRGRSVAALPSIVSRAG